MRSLRDSLLGLRARFPESLLAGRGWDRLLDRIGVLPAAAAGACGFEMRLGDPEPAVDFSVAVTPGPVARHYVVDGAGAAPASPEAWLSGHLSGTLGLDDWSDWMVLAYDIVADPRGAGHRTPAVYLSPASIRPSLDTAFAQNLLAGALGRAAGRRNHDHERRALARALEALPSQASVVFAAVAPDRTPRCVRLVVTDVLAPRLGLFLNRLQWTGSVATVLRFLSGVKDVSTRFMIAFDVTPEGVLPRLGLEIYPTCSNRDDYHALLATWLTTTTSDWRGLVDRLVDMGLCLPMKAAGLLSWPKRHNIYGQDGIFRLHMGINHVKITISGESLGAKAYAGLRFLPLEPPPKENAPGGSTG